MPCVGCIKRKEMNMGVTGNFWMRFIGKPNGVFMKGAPGNFIHGQKYKVPYGHSKFPYWELLEEEPVLQVFDDVGNSVYEDAVYTPDEPGEEVVVDKDSEWSYTETEEYEVTVSEPVEVEVTASTQTQGVEMNTHTPMIIDGVDYSPNAPAILEPYGTFSPATGEVGEHKDELVAKNRGEQSPELTRDDLLKVLSDAGVEVKPRTRTTTLKKMIDELEEAKE